MKNNATNKPEAIDIPDEVDFRHGDRGKYVYRFGETKRDEDLAAEFLRSKGFQVERIDIDRFAKTPDFRLLKNGRLVAYCEVKTFERDAWLDKMLAGVPAGTLVGGARPDPIYNRIANSIHTAAQQLIAANPAHEHLNLLVLVNQDKQATWKDLISVAAGKWDPIAGIHEPTHTQFSEGRIREEKYRIDLYVWMDAYKKMAPGDERYFFGNPQNRSMICSLFDLREDSIRTVA